MRRLVHERDQRRAREQVGLQLGEHVVAEHAREHDVEVGEQARAARDIGARHRRPLGLEVRAQLGDLRVGDRRTQAPDERAFDHLAQLEDLPGLLDARHRDVRSARRLERDEAVAAELVQRLAHERARDVEDVGDALFGELGAGHQASFDDRRGDRLDDAPRRRRLGVAVGRTGSAPRARRQSRGLRPDDVQLGTCHCPRDPKRSVDVYSEVYTLCRRAQRPSTRPEESTMSTATMTSTMPAGAPGSAVDEKLPPLRLAALGIQHVLVMYAGAVAVPLIVGRALKLTPEQVALLISADLFCCGLVTLIQSWGVTRWFGIRLPVMMGVTFAAVGPMVAFANATPGVEGARAIFGAIIGAGIVSMIIAPAVSKLLRFFPPVVTGTIIAIIGISLMRVGVGWAMGAPAPLAQNVDVPKLVAMVDGAKAAAAAAAASA